MAWSDAARAAAAEIRRLRISHNQPKWTAWRENGQLVKTEWVKLKNLRPARSQVWSKKERQSKTTRAIIRKMSIDMRRKGTAMPALIVSKAGYIEDGNHRFFAAKRAGLRIVRANIIPVTSDH